MIQWPAMETILVFSTSIGRAHADMLSGVREFAKDASWNIQSFVYDGKPFPVRELMCFWAPAGCIVEGCGNCVSSDIMSRRAFGRIPVVYVGSEPAITPDGAACVVHDATAVANAAARELMSAGMAHFAFVGAGDKDWSIRRRNAFAEAMRLNEREISHIEVQPTPAGIYGRDAKRLGRWLAGLAKPCGLMAANDEIAAAILSVCRVAGIAVPNDIAVVGVDNDEPLCENTAPTLSSVCCDFRQGGRLAARLLAQMLRDGRKGLRHATFGVSGIARRGSTRVLRRKDPAVSVALERIWAPGGVRLTAGEVLSGFGCSRRNAEIRFRRAIGRSVVDELVKARVERAKKLLDGTSLPVSAVGEQCGYRHLTTFRSLFRRETGMNPLAWRKQATP